MRRLALCLALVSLTALACKPKEPAATPTPAVSSVAATTPFKSAEQIYMERANAQLEFIAVALHDHRETLEQVTCHCCGKPLATCYEQTLTGAQGACPPT